MFCRASGATLFPMIARSRILVALLLLPIVATIIGLPISIRDPGMKPAMARFFFASMTAAAAGHSLYFRGKLTALFIILCGAAVLMME